MTATTTRRVRAALYVRISRDRVGAGLGVQRQEQDCRQLAATLGWDVVDVFVDNDISASGGRKHRPNYQRMLTAIRDGQVDAVLAWHTDRIHRSSRELLDYIDVCAPRDVATHCVRAGVMDLSTANGRMVAKIAGAIAEGETEHMSERIRAQKAAQRAKGATLGGTRPFGYEPGGMVIRKREAACIRRGVRQVLAGASLRSVAAAWSRGCPPTCWTSGRVEKFVTRDRTAFTDAHVRLHHQVCERIAAGEDATVIAADLSARAVPLVATPWTPSSVRRILANPRNAGLVAHHGEIVEGVTAAWPAIIDTDTWHALCLVLADPERRSAETSSRQHVGSALYRCVCGSDMRTGGRNAQGEPTYVCRARPHVSILADPVDALVFATVEGLLRRDGAGLLLTDTDNTVDELCHEATVLRTRLAELADSYADGEITRAEWTRARDRITTNLDAVEHALVAQMGGSVLAGVANAADPVAALRATGFEQRRAIVNELVVVSILPGKRGRPTQAAGGIDPARVRIEPRHPAPDQAADIAA